MSASGQAAVAVQIAMLPVRFRGLFHSGQRQSVWSRPSLGRTILTLVSKRTVTVGAADADEEG